LGGLHANTRLKTVHVISPGSHWPEFSWLFRGPLDYLKDVSTMDTGTAYGRPVGASLLELAQVGPGTPYGEVLRRYWQPVALSAGATTTPKRLRILSEDLILFRTKRGKAGLVVPDCAHRGASLFYGRVEDEGIRCCYHGWIFDTEGRCLEQPCEPDLGRHRDRVRQPWYPVREYHGVVFAYTNG
jgi:nitrite reductase/ring-hydroxylating ferredoxin subunit